MEKESHNSANDFLCQKSMNHKEVTISKPAINGDENKNPKTPELCSSEIVKTHSVPQNLAKQTEEEITKENLKKDPEIQQPQQQSQQQPPPIPGPLSIKLKAEKVAKLYTKKCNFMTDIKPFYKKMHSFILRIPYLGGNKIDLHRIFIETMKRGGFEEVNKNDLWNDIHTTIYGAEIIKDGDFAIRVYYATFLSDFENYLFNKIDLNRVTLEEDDPKPAVEEKTEPKNGGNIAPNNRQNGIFLQNAIPIFCPDPNQIVVNLRTYLETWQIVPPNFVQLRNLNGNKNFLVANMIPYNTGNNMWRFNNPNLNTAPHGSQPQLPRPPPNLIAPQEGSYNPERHILVPIISQNQPDNNQAGHMPVMNSLQLPFFTNNYSWLNSQNNRDPN